MSVADEMLHRESVAVVGIVCAMQSECVKKREILNNVERRVKRVSGKLAG